MRWSFFLYIAVLLFAATSVIATVDEIFGDIFDDENRHDETRHDLENETTSPTIEEQINNLGETTSVRPMEN